MEKVTLTFVRDVAKTSKEGKPYVSKSIKTQEYGEAYLSGFGNKDNQSWKVGDTVEILVKKVQKEDKEYLNFETPKKEDKQNEKIEIVLTKLGHHGFMLDRILSILEEDRRGKPVKYTNEKGEEVETAF